MDPFQVKDSLLNQVFVPIFFQSHLLRTNRTRTSSTSTSTSRATARARARVRAKGRVRATATVRATARVRARVRATARMRARARGLPESARPMATVTSFYLTTRMKNQVEVARAKVLLELKGTIDNSLKRPQAAVKFNSTTTIIQCKAFKGFINNMILEN